MFERGLKETEHDAEYVRGLRGEGGTLRPAGHQEVAVVLPLRKELRGYLPGKDPMCEDCEEKGASYGLQGNKKRRWSIQSSSPPELCRLPAEGELNFSGPRRLPRWQIGCAAPSYPNFLDMSD